MSVSENPNAKILNGEATHANKNARIWQVNWTARSGPATVTFYVAGLASNGGGTSGDAWNTAVYNAPVVPEFFGMILLVALAAASLTVLTLTRKRAFGSIR